MGYEQGASVYQFQAALPCHAAASSRIPLTYGRGDLVQVGRYGRGTVIF